MENEFLPKIGITIGDVNGIGPEVLLKAISTNRINKICTPIIYGSGKHLSRYKQVIDMHHWQYVGINEAKQAQSKNSSLINCLKGDYFEIEFGKKDPKAGKLAFDSLERATNDLKKGEIDGLVTAPISKENIQSENFKFPGHTEYLAKKFEKNQVLMLMVSDDLRIGVVTGHVPLSDIKNKLTKELISEKLRIFIDSLKIDFGIQKPKIAVLGLNPHAGENGLLGEEENNVIIPVIKDFTQNGNIVIGPFPTDGFFANGSYKKFDGILAMYHDQGLTPFKMMAFESGVNFTAGLMGIRTSPDHGTAFDIAGKNQADANSMLSAIYLAVDIAKKRKEFVELETNALKHQKIDLENLKKERH
ncbi:MAG: 4-hydroxythreonine-4-phosphate dehydrogenase PdxA [Cytophagaceae bacterium]|nr:4-hydroxythreonine-4-phosphate dehydrogenase PdxA [Cytophagaceae bacterium]MBK9509617.1 4-hydroxythreonine-4-phosphate dehydrogenase PdxA [Cytophagaceae bacterium]MBK9936197.1 4-hydroxythreonine-4-phosphate dehydrogenase PdxA [Cytophagaceae bacterium]MBL0303913.1 4-hydroxythreonine-4-phosphate dehydrogenase PdxA [Cytophagaceae bacterium]